MENNSNRGEVSYQIWLFKDTVKGCAVAMCVCMWLEVSRLMVVVFILDWRETWLAATNCAGPKVELFCTSIAAEVCCIFSGYQFLPRQEASGKWIFCSGPGFSMNPALGMLRMLQYACQASCRRYITGADQSSNTYNTPARMTSCHIAMSTNKQDENDEGTHSPYVFADRSSGDVSLKEGCVF